MPHPQAEGLGVTRECDAIEESPRVESQTPEASSVQKQEIHAVSYALYYFVLFFAYWFGANRFDVDGDGDFDPEDVEAYLEDHGYLHRNFRHTRKAGEVRSNKSSEKLSLTKAASQEEPAAAQSANNTSGLHSMLDRDGDGHVDVADMIVNTVEGTEAEEDKVLTNLTTGQVFPYFMAFEIVVTFTLWFVCACVKAANEGADWFYVQAGLDTFSEDAFTLTLSKGDCVDLRSEAWRWIMYQFTHVGLSHVGMNTLLNIMLGVPLEGLHRWWRMAIMFNVGVLGGAFCYFVGDSHGVVVGCSGGCYALIGVHIADLLLNWKQKKFRIPTVFLLISLIFIDIIVYYTSETSGKSNSAHIGGAIAGVCIGVLVGKNMYVEAHEKIIIGVLFIFGAFCTIFSISWMLAQTDGPRNIFEAAKGESGWCWYKQVWDDRINPNAYECVRCGTKECINQTLQLFTVLPVSWDECESKGRWHDL